MEQMDDKASQPIELTAATSPTESLGGDTTYRLEATPAPAPVRAGMNIADEVAEILRGSGGRMMGARLGAELRKRGLTPALLGFRNLSSLLLSACPGLKPVGGNGSDTYWEMSSVAEEEPRPAEVWRAISSPGSFAHLVVMVSRTDGSYRIGPNSGFGPIPSTLGDQWGRIPPVTSEEIRAAADRFVEGLPHSSLKTELTSALSSERWWLQWPNLFSGHTSEARAWTEAKQETIARHLAKALSDLGLTGEVFDRANRYPLSQPAAPKRHLAVPRVDAPRWSQRFNANLLRELLIEIIPQMEDEDLRSIRVPLGLVADAVQRRSR